MSIAQVYSIAKNNREERDQAYKSTSLPTKAGASCMGYRIKEMKGRVLLIKGRTITIFSQNKW